MANHQELLDAIAQVGAHTGDPGAWMAGLSTADIATAMNPASPPAALDGVLARIRAGHRGIFGDTPARPAGDAVDSIRAAEIALARQNSVAAQVDLQVVTAVLNAHAARAAGAAALDRLQQEIEAAVDSRTDLGTAAGARSFQGYLIDKLRDIRSVLEDADLDSTSKAALAAALASLYASAGPMEAPPASEKPWRPEESRPVIDGDASAASNFPFAGDAGLLGMAAEEPAPDDPDPVEAPPAAAPAVANAAPVPAAPTGMPTTGAPLGGGMPPLPPLSIPPLSVPSMPVSSLPEPEVPDPAAESESPDDGDPPSDAPPDDTQDPVALPNGETLDADLAPVVSAAVAGTPIPDAFRQQGITIPPPGSPIASPVQTDQVGAGDIGLFADRHALALGNGKVLLDQQIQPIASMTGPGFIGWIHPPAPDRDVTPGPPAAPPQAPTPATDQ